VSQPDADLEARFAINVLEDADNEILLLKRRPDASLGPGLWGFPAGHIEPGETAAECAIRELEEEIGTDFDRDLIAKLGPLRDSFYGGVFEIHLFHWRWLGGQITLNREHTAYAWVGRDDYFHYPVMDGIDEDIFYLGIWPVDFLNPAKLP
jgi:8-oxo-dGTP pyrophosphatase MutT (NUDIX family)